MRTLETERLILRDWKMSDLDDYFKIMSNPNVAIPEGSLPQKSKDECLPTFKYLLQAKNNYALVFKETMKVIGSVGLNEDADGNENARNLGFCLDEEYWNQGIMTEALRTIISNAVEITPMLSMGHVRGNTKTEHIAKKLGFIYTKTFPNVKYESNELPQDLLYYILRFKPAS
jgi:ribosomal-protein-alanine N-acetyltransferase